VGVNALYSNTGSSNTAIGVNALVSNTAGSENVAVGQGALANNRDSSGNTAIGFTALHNNSTGSGNTGIGESALAINSTGSGNTGIGQYALQGGGGNYNTAIGQIALLNNDSGSNNTAIGAGALFDAGLEWVCNGNTAVGKSALVRLGNSPFGPGYGHNNTALGLGAGSYLSRGSGNVYIGESMVGDSSGEESNHTYIRNINTTSLSYGGAAAVTVDLTTGLLGHLTSSRRFKEEIKPMDKASEALYRLRPVTFHYKKELAATQSPAFGLIAEDVAEVNPNLVARNLEGQPESIHYEMVNAMLLNEFLKEHRKVEGLEAMVADLVTTVKKQAAQIEKISTRVEMNEAAPQTVLNRR
jgi:hypothetical protein